MRNILETEEFKLEVNLKRFISLNIKHLVDINCYRGNRRLKGLPVRGQRTLTNSRTSRRQSIFICKLYREHIGKPAPECVFTPD